MTDPRDPLGTDAALANALRDLGAHLAFPPTPPLSDEVVAAIARQRVPDRRRTPRFPTHRLLAAAAVLLLLLVGALLASAGLRSAVADLLGVRGIRIVVEREPAPTPIVASPAATTAPVASQLLFGQRVTLPAAQAAVSFAIQLPADPRLGPPDEIYLRALPDGNRMVSLVYLADAGLPETGATGIGLLLMQFESRGDTTYLAKTVAEGDGPLALTIGGRPGWWIPSSHALTLLTDPSQGCCGPTRASGSVLLWEAGGITLRLESALTRAEALTIAESITPLTATPGN